MCRTACKSTTPWSTTPSTILQESKPSWRGDRIGTSGSMAKRGYHGTYHRMSAKHLDRYVTEFSGRHNDQDADTIDQIAHMAQGGNQLNY